ncbi:LysR family transcriptional regulator [Methylobacterium sp. J-070]|uniref:LysR family transcriptional regulator n=1 Tax=Methylobacterium sp. J-070 TaxID=2836650 RepID=UPI001FBA6F8E|nr:LysR family transcriptional regulator [Methylobacterium sp. J-070]MCJ2048946.1 LysR substrate-binding domain-containing protein [Methylobacterium sp. J-070]
MDAADLRIFESVARYESMNRAATELHTVQSNVTARIKGLEDELGVALFSRHARGVTLTPAGQRMLPFAGRIAKLFAEARTAALDDGPPSGELVLGTLETSAALRLAPSLARFAQAYPKVRLVLRVGTTQGLAAEVLACRLDGAFVAGPVTHANLRAEPIFQEELVLLTPRAIRSPADLTGAESLRLIVFRRGCSYRQRLEAYLAQLGVVAAEPLEFGSLDAILACVAAGVGVTLLPRSVADTAHGRAQLAVHTLPPAIAHVDTVFIVRSDAYLSSAMAAFLDVVRPKEAVSVAAE